MLTTHTHQTGERTRQRHAYASFAFSTSVYCARAAAQLGLQLPGCGYCLLDKQSNLLASPEPVGPHSCSRHVTCLALHCRVSAFWRAHGVTANMALSWHMRASNVQHAGCICGLRAIQQPIVSSHR
jgi:hypothetical protein